MKTTSTQTARPSDVVLQGRAVILKPRPGFRPLAPAPSAAPATPTPRSNVTFMDLPAELRIEVYRLALLGVHIHILPMGAADDRKIPHALTRVTKQIRQEVTPMIHSLCPIRCTVTDFNFEGLMAWINRIHPDHKGNLVKNRNLEITICSSNVPIKILSSLRSWLQYRADKYHPRAPWQYCGPTPHSKVRSDLRRRASRMTELGKQQEMLAILEGIGIDTNFKPKPGRREESEE